MNRHACKSVAGGGGWRLAVGRLLVGMVMSTATWAWASPRIFCDQSVADFGDQEVGVQLEHRFVIGNRGDQQLVLRRVIACCGATATLSRTELGPGETTELAVVFTLPRQQRGAWQRSIYVVSDDHYQPRLEVQLKGEAINHLQLSRDEVDFGLLAATAKRSRTVSFQVPEAEAFEVLSIDSTLPFVQARLNWLATGWGELRFQTLPPLPKDRFEGRVTVRTNSSKHPFFSFVVRGRVDGPVWFYPGFIDLGGGGQPTAQSISLFSPSQQPFVVKAVKTPHEGVSWRVVNQAAGRTVLVFEHLDRAKLAAADFPRFEVTIDSEPPDALLIPIVGF